MVGVDEHRRRRAVAADHLHDPAVAHLRDPPPAPLDGRRHAEHAEVGQALDHRGRDVGLAIDRGGVDVGVGELPDGRDGRLDARPLGLRQLGVGEQDIAVELAAEQGPGEAGRRALAPSSSSAWRSCLARSASSLSGAVGCSGAEIVVAIACLLSRLRGTGPGPSIVAGPR